MPNLNCILLESEQEICFLSDPSSNLAQSSLTVSPGTANVVTSIYDLLFSPKIQKFSNVIKLSS